MAAQQSRWSGHSASGAGPRTVISGVAVAVAGGLTVLILRVMNGGTEPEGRNWWIAVGLLLAVSYIPVGAVMMPRRRILGLLFVTVGVTQLVDAVATEYAAHAQYAAGS